MSDEPHAAGTMLDMVERMVARRGGSVEISDLVYVAAERGIYSGDANEALSWLELRGKISIVGGTVRLA